METRDDRLVENDTKREEALTASDTMYDGMISSNEAKESEMLGKLETNKTQQEAIQNQKTEQAINEINQQKEWAEKDYIKEQSGAYTDYTKQTAKHGVNAEKMASNGLTDTGYAESSMVSMYNAYQNRVATARESFVRAVQNYDNQATQARLANSAALAEIAAQTLEKSLSISMSFVQQNNSLLQAKADAHRTIDQNYWQREYSIIQQMNAEAELALKREQWEWQKAQAAASASGSGGSGGGGGSSSGGSGSSKVTKENTSKVTSNKTSDGVTVDTKSITALGYGPISAAKLDELIREGKVIEYQDGNTIKYKKASTGGTAISNATGAGQAKAATSASSSDKSNSVWKKTWNKIKSWFS